MKAKAGRLVRPWSSFSSADANQTDYPALKHFFPCEDGAGTYGLRDVVGGVVYAPNGWTVPEAYAIRPTHTSELDYTNGGHHNEPLTSGHWHRFGTKETLVFLVHKSDTFSFGMGDSNTQKEISFSNTYFLNTVIDGSTSVMAGFATSAPTSLPTVTGGIIKPGNTLTGVYTDVNGAVQTTAPVSMAALTSIPVLPDIGSIGGYTAGISALFGFAVFSFQNGIPSDVNQALEWMRAEWARGNKAIYPGWAGRT